MSRNIPLFFLCLLVVAVAVLTAIFFKPTDIFTNTPVYNDDYSLHLSQCLSTKRFLSSEGKCWGYDPFLLAGFPNGALANADNKAWELTFFAFSSLLDEGLAFKLYVLFFLLSYPFFLYGAARNFTLSRATSLSAATLGILFFHLSLAKDFVYWGMISYVFACFFSIYVLSLFYKLLEKFSWMLWLRTTILSSALLLMHILSPFHIALPILLLLIGYYNRMSKVQVMLILLIPVAILCANSFWIMPIVDFYRDTTTRPENYEFTLQITNIFEPLKVYLLQQKSINYSILALNNTFIDVILLLFGAYGFYRWYSRRLFYLLASLSAGALCMFFIAFYGSQTVFLSKFQPERFALALSLLLIIPAGEGVWAAGESILRCKRPAAIFFIACLSFVLLFRPVIRPFGIFYKNALYRLACTFPLQLTELLTFFEKQTTRDGRILVEDAEFIRAYSVHEYYGGHYPGLFPEHVKREYLCGPRPMYPMKHSYASFTRGVLFEKNIKDYTPEELKALFDIYNVMWIVAWFQESKDFFNQLPGYITKMTEIDKFTVYAVNRQPSFVLKGSGNVHADYNRIEVSGAHPEDGEIILAYHWMKQLRAIPDAAVERVFLGGDPIGFIKIKNPPQSFALINGY
ncbi:MAG: hypothetical protein WCQ99_03660 [Pseudomonadota bacterium]